MFRKFRALLSLALALLLLFLLLPIEGLSHTTESMHNASDISGAQSVSGSSSGLSLALNQSLTEAQESFAQDAANQSQDTQADPYAPLPYDGFVPGTDVAMPESDLPYMAVIYIGSQRVVIYEKDDQGHYTVPHYVFTVSTGLGNNTIRGTYRIQHRWRWLPMHGIYCQYVTQWQGNYLFHSVMYSWTNPSTIDRSAYSKLGQKASAGCIRMTVRDAKWIYENLERGTYVISTNAAMPEGLPGSEGVPPMTMNVRWDPTDPDERNPYLAQEEDAAVPMPTPRPAN
ncbi:MAG: L,D-transpeptidase [Clostridia bacterium]|nr:L,D-transpeptidase [Clostridia bacterium]